MTVFWFCRNCLHEGGLEFEPTADAWAVVDAVRRAHWKSSYQCHDLHGVGSIRINDGLIFSTTEWQALKDEARRELGNDRTKNATTRVV